MLKKINFWMTSFLLLHVMLWSFAPAVVRYTLPMDAMEGATWGHQLALGYDKNPFMNAWLTAFAVHFGGLSGWLVYLFSQLSVGICFLCVFILGKKILNPLYALCGVMLLEGIQYYNFHAIDFNDNVLELGFWALTILFFYDALQKKDNLNWILTGVFAGLSMMVKYFTVVLLLPMLFFLLIDTQARQNFKLSPLYLGLLVFLIIIAPHFIWLFSHDFITINYAFNRVSSADTQWTHLFFPAQFAWQMFEAILPALILLMILVIPTSPGIPASTVIPAKAGISSTDPRFRRDDVRFLYFVAFGPFIITLLLSMIFGLKLRAGWGQPLFSLWGLAFFALIQPTISMKKLYRFMSTIFLILILMVAGYIYALTKANDPSSANFPGKNISSFLSEKWATQFHSPLKYVAGTRNLAGNIAFYAKDHPAVYMDWDNKISFWINEAKLKETGAIFVWDLSNDTISYDAVKKRFPNVGSLISYTFPWMRNKGMKPITIQVAFLPPQNLI